MGTIDKNINGYEEKRHTLQRKRLTIRHSTGAIKRKFQSNFSKTNTPTHRVKTKQKRLETPTVETSEHIVRHEIKNTEHLQFASVVAAHKALSHIVDDDPSIKTRRALEKQAREQLSYYMISREYNRIIEDDLDSRNSKVTFSLIDWINNIFSMYLEELHLNNIELVKKGLLLGTKEYVVDGELAPILYACVNLCKNAIKFANKNIKGIITVSLKEQNGRFIIEVEDNGIGMTQEQTRHLFDKARKRFTNRPGSGSGLGNVMRRLEDASGKMAVESELDKWTKFTITAPPLEIKEIIQDVVDYSLVRVLVVDDERINCSILKNILLQIGIATENITTANSEQKAIELYETGHNEMKPFTFVFTDLNMEEENDGLNVIKRIRQFESKKEIGQPAHILILSGNDMREQIKKMEGQYNGYVQKPNTLQVIKSHIIPAVLEINRQQRQERKNKINAFFTGQFLGIEAENCTKITSLITEYDSNPRGPRS